MGIDISYLAGFVDGEGCFWADIQLRSSPILDIANTNLDILNTIADYMESETGIRPPIKVKSDGNPNHSTGYHLVAGARILRLFLQDLIPYLQIKHEHAITVQQILEFTPYKSGPGHETNREERKLLTGYLKWLNQGCP